MSENTWRFPTIKGGTKQGLTTGDKETFKKAPFTSLAREVLQNSIDVGVSEDEPVKVEFKSFSIPVERIPGLDELKAQIKRCINYWPNENIKKVYGDMVRMLEKPSINCLRISDFNTSGLVGISSNSLEENNFLALTKGTGVSQKVARTAGGSKGVGKNAVITLSNLGLVFYSTITNTNEKGSIGVANFISGYPTDDATDTNVFTQGAGYYSKDDDSSPLDDLISLDENFVRKEVGTDIYAIGFRDDDEWEKEVISSVIDSYIVAIYKERLTVKINDVLIDKEHLKEIINSDKCFSDKTKKNIAICGYRILSGEGDVHTFDIETEYGNPHLYVMPIDKKEEDIATHLCSMIRYPYMRIKNFSLNSSFRVAAMCIIENDDLGSMLREIENPEHTDWYPKYINDKSTAREISGVIQSIYNQIEQHVLEVIQQGDDGAIDPAKAGEFLPAVESGNSNSDNGQNKENKEVEETHTTAFKANNTSERKTPVDDSEGSSTIPYIGTVTDEPGNDPYPDGDNGGQGGPVRPGPNEGTVKEGDGIVLKNVDKSAVKYKFIVINKNEGNYRIIFTSPIDHEECYLTVNMLDDSNNSSIIELKKVLCNGKELVFEDGKEAGPFAIYTNTKCTLDIQTVSVKGLFGSEVKVICK